MARDLGAYPETDDYIALIAASVDAELEGVDFTNALEERDSLWVDLIFAKRSAGQLH